MGKKADLGKSLYWYQFYYKDWRSSRSVNRMSLAARGLYRELIDECWDVGHIPSDAGALAEVANCEQMELEAVWPRVKPHFIPDPLDEKYLINERVTRERQGKQEMRLEKQITGQKGGLAKAANQAAKAKADAAPSVPVPPQPDSDVEENMMGFYTWLAEHWEVYLPGASKWPQTPKPLEHIRDLIRAGITDAGVSDYSYLVFLAIQQAREQPDFYQAPQNKIQASKLLQDYLIMSARYLTKHHTSYEPKGRLYSYQGDWPKTENELDRSKFYKSDMEYATEEEANEAKDSDQIQWIPVFED